MPIAFFALGCPPSIISSEREREKKRDRVKEMRCCLKSGSLNANVIDFLCGGCTNNEPKTVQSRARDKSQKRLYAMAKTSKITLGYNDKMHAHTRARVRARFRSLALHPDFHTRRESQVTYSNIVFVSHSNLSHSKLIINNFSIYFNTQSSYSWASVVCPFPFVLIYVRM